MTQRKLRNPTPYHLLATQQPEGWQQPHQDDFSLEDDSYLSPLHDFDDLDYNKQQQYNNGSSATHPHHIPTHPPPPSMDYQHGVGGLLSSSSNNNNNEESPSEYSFASSSPSRRWPPFPMSAPAEIGFNDFYSTSSPGHMNPGALALQPQPPQHGSLQDDYAVQMNLQMMMEKKRRRRESHNAVERRRRENINERIQELGTLLPEHMLDECSSNSAGGTGNKPNKGHILRKSVDHIKLLQHDVSSYRQRIRELETILAKIQQA
ncbi:hypothetical protein INT45_004151 [Circinella minor]|uniref:BHLH domain-containing protein n=1 Tax=Circinella minor TaxID=1195481 RepID=A0A8H7S1L7_9FUNG|nr:hypothetical protein INT45_004151 [Circinella minor]